MIAVLIAALFLSIVLAVSIGSVELPVGDVYHVLVYNILDTFGVDIGGYEMWGKGISYDIVWNIRAPRIFLAALVGMTLALAGVVMQATVQNPLADPHTAAAASGVAECTRRNRIGLRFRCLQHIVQVNPSPESGLRAVEGPAQMPAEGLTG